MVSHLCQAPDLARNRSMTPQMGIGTIHRKIYATILILPRQHTKRTLDPLENTVLCGALWRILLEPPPVAQQKNEPPPLPVAQWRTRGAPL